VTPCSGEGWGFYGRFNSGLGYRLGGFLSLAVDLHAWPSSVSWSVCPLLGVGGKTTLRTFCLSALWQIYETLYLLLRVQECRFITPSQGAGLIVLAMGDGILTHSSAL
jgi:hypothetical protein